MSAGVNSDGIQGSKDDLHTTEGRVSGVPHGMNSENNLHTKSRTVSGSLSMLFAGQPTAQGYWGQSI